VSVIDSLHTAHEPSSERVIDDQTMPRPTRRSLISGGLAGAAGLLLPHASEAAVFRALSLASLLGKSDHVLVVTALGSECRRVPMGGSTRIVTDTRMRVVRSLGQQSTPDAELMVRTLGGIVGDRGEFVDGEATLPPNESAVIFVRRHENGLHGIVGMAQGHYPLRADARGTLRLNRSPRLPRLIRSRVRAAADELTGLDLDGASERIRAVAR
jgi:hypothetical protein